MKIYLLYLILSICYACAQAPTPSYTPKPSPPASESDSSELPSPEQPQNKNNSPKPDPKQPWKMLSWDLSCEGDAEGGEVISGYGNHFIPHNTDQIVIKVGVCPAKVRTVFLAVDVSLNAATVDPYTNDSCGRVKSIHNILDGLGEDIAIELVGFDQRVRYELKAANKEQLKSEIIARSICGYYSTQKVRLEAGLNNIEQRVKNLPLLSRKNIYLITAGKSFLPNDGKAAAEALHNTYGVTLSTISYLQHQDYLSQNIASKIHGEQVLAHTMSKEGALSTSDLLFPEDSYTLHIRYKSVSDSEYEELFLQDVWDHEIDLRDFAQREGGLDFEASYWNNMGEIYEYEARLVLQ
jgi:hypothetical protein